MSLDQLLQHANHPDPYEEQRRVELLTKWHARYGGPRALEMAQRWEQRDQQDAYDSEQAQRRHGDFKRAQWQALQAVRADQTLGARLDRALNDAALLAGASAANAEGVRTSMSKPTTSPPPSAGLLLDGKGTVSDLAGELATLIAKLERELDLAHGRIPAPSSEERQAAMAAELANEFRGFTPLQVSETAPHLGSPAAIREGRRRLDLDPETGRPLTSLVFTSSDKDTH